MEGEPKSPEMSRSEQIDYWLERKEVAEKALAYAAIQLISLGYSNE